MMRRLEELDRLDAMTRTPEEVLWPGGRSSRHDPRAWTPPRSKYREPGHSWWERHRAMSAVVVVGVLAAVVVWPNELVALLPGRAERPAGVGIPDRSDEVASERLIPAVEPPSGTSPSSYAWMMTQPDGTEPVTFDPCRPIHYVTNVSTPAPQVEELIHEAVALLGAASGLRFVHDGSTTESPTQQRQAFQSERYGNRWAPVLIAWSDEVQEPRLVGKAGLGGGIPWRDTRGHLTYVSGTVWLNGPSLAKHLSDERGGDTVRAVVVHEVGHVLGAGHPQSPDQLMSERGAGSLTLAKGDLHALAILGRGDCVPGL